MYDNARNTTNWRPWKFLAEIETEQQVLTTWGSLHGSVVGLEGRKKWCLVEALKKLSLEKIHVIPSSLPTISLALLVD